MYTIFGLWCKITGLVTKCLVTYPTAFFHYMLPTCSQSVASVFDRHHNRKKTLMYMIFGLHCKITGPVADAWFSNILGMWLILNSLPWHLVLSRRWSKIHALSGSLFILTVRIHIGSAFEFTTVGVDCTLELFIRLNGGAASSTIWQPFFQQQSFLHATNI